MMTNTIFNIEIEQIRSEYGVMKNRTKKTTS